MVNGWKVTAIIFIILFLLETALMVFIFKVGYDSIKNDKVCMTNICKLRGADSYYFYQDTSICECYKNGVVEHTEVIK